MAILFVIGVLTIVTLLYYYAKREFNYWSDRNVPTLAPSIPLGNLNGVGSKVHWCDRLTEVYEKFKKNNRFAGFYFLFSPRFIPIDLDIVRDVLVKDFNKFHDRGLFTNTDVDPMAGHLFNLEGEKWKDMRTKLSPTFTSGKMKSMFSIIAETTEDLKNYITNVAEKNTPVDIKNLCVRYSADVIGSCAFGLECHCLKTDSSELLEIADDVFDFRSVSKRTSFFVQNSFPKLARLLKLRLFTRKAESYFMKIIRDTVDYREESATTRNDFMNLLIQIYKFGIIKEEGADVKVGKISFNEMAAQAFVFFFAGFETTSTTMSYAMYELACNQEIQEKAREEVNRVFAKHDGKFTYEAVMELNYIGQIIDETLRKHPPVHTLFRKATADYSVPGTDFVLAKGTEILIPVYQIHHDANIYEEPNKFDPDRFKQENVAKRHNYSFLPFGDGPRNCIGMRFALLEARLGIAEMLKSFSFTVNSKTSQPLKLDVTDLNLVIKGGLWLNCQKI